MHRGALAAVAAAAVVGAGGLTGLVLSHARAAQATAVAAPAPAAPSSPADQARIAYPEHLQPTVTLPDGRREVIRSVLNIPSAMTYGDYVWNETGAPQGPVWVRVDPGAQIISVFRAGHEIGSAVILFGADGKPTPVGLFPVLQKAKDYHSHTYDAPMPFMLRLTADGVAIHASNVRQGWATHGCIGVPPEFAQRLFAQVKLGDPVLVVPYPSKGGGA